MKYGAVNPDSETEALVSRILELVSVQAIFLLGRTKTERQTTSIFLDSSLTAVHISHYYLLLLIDKDEEMTAGQVQDKIENSLQHSFPVTAVVLSTAAFFSWASQGHDFASQVLRKADLLYAAEALLLPLPPPSKEENREKQNRSLYDQTRSKAESFLAGAELYGIRKEYQFAAFMLHQATEQILRTMLIIYTGYRANTHSLVKLLRYCTLFCPQLLDLFPKSNERAKKLFSLLTKAYIDARYKDDFVISHEELRELTGKVERIRQLFEQYAPPRVVNIAPVGQRPS